MFLKWIPRNDAYMYQIIIFNVDWRIIVWIPFDKCALKTDIPAIPSKTR